MVHKSFFQSISDPNTVVTAIESGSRFPELVTEMRVKYDDEIRKFAQLVKVSESSADLLGRIRSSSIPANQRMSLLKIFRRSVSGVCDTEATKKIKAISTQSIVDAYGHTFKPIAKLQEQFEDLPEDIMAVLAVSIGEYDGRGQQGYALTGMFFDWFEDRFGKELILEGPRGAGPDVELNSVVPEFDGSCPCDFVIRDRTDEEVKAVGFARYDSTRGGAQSDDRTGGNANKVDKIQRFCTENNRLIRIIFLADGPGLTHRDTWEEACKLDDVWDGNVRVTTLKTAEDRLTLGWMLGE